MKKRWVVVFVVHFEATPSLVARTWTEHGGYRVQDRMPPSRFGWYETRRRRDALTPTTVLIERELSR